MITVAEAKYRYGMPPETKLMVVRSGLREVRLPYFDHVLDRTEIMTVYLDMPIRIDGKGYMAGPMKQRDPWVLVVSRELKKGGAE